MRVVIKDDLHPEDNAMLQALYSRDPRSVDTHLERVRAVGSGKFMNDYYVGYNHASIGDCGSTTIYIEGISMLAAKAIQSWPLYSGQESSTRYIDFNTQPILDVLNNPISNAIIEELMEFYRYAKPKLIDHLRTVYPKAEGDDETKYGRAIEARSFDVLRGFLPAGATTNCSWHTNLRQAADALRALHHHPLDEVRGIAASIHEALRARYPHSFGHVVTDEAKAWQDECAEQLLISYSHAIYPHSFIQVRLNSSVMARHLRLLQARPRYGELPYWVEEWGQIHSRFDLDFGSFRDLHRHRNGVVRMPVLSTELGFHPWYLSEMPVDMRVLARQVLGETEAWANSLLASPLERQYYVPMGYMVPCEVTQPLNAFIYRIELRSQKTVHPTLRRAVQNEARDFQEWCIASLGVAIPLYVDHDESNWSVRRGQQTIVEKKNA